MKNPKLKLLLIAPVATGLIVLSSTTRSDAFVTDMLKSLWNQTTQIVSDRAHHYLGEYVNQLSNHYIPRGLQKIAGALGLPDTGGIFGEIQKEAEQNKTDNNDIAAGDLQKGDVAASTTQSIGEAVFSQEGQEVAKETSEASANLTQSSAEVAEKCQSVDVSQEVMKCLAIQNANQAQQSQIMLNQQRQLIEQIAVGNIANAKSLDLKNQEARAKQAESDRQANDMIKQVQINNALVTGLASQ